MRSSVALREFAELLHDANLTESVLENIEAGRKADLPLSAILNIAQALRVPPPFLFAPLTSSAGGPDLPNLSSSIRDMTAAEFRAWMAGDASGAYRPIDAAERNELAELEAHIELERTKRELERETISGNLGSGDRSRADFLQRRTSELTEFLRSAGWQM